MLINTEPDPDSEMCPDPVLRRLSVQLTDCSSWLGPRNHIRLDEESVPVPCLPAGDKTPEGKSFQLPDGLQSHQSIHWDKAAYRCTMCYKQFMREDDLRDHNLAHLSIEPFQGHERGQTTPNLLDRTTLNLFMSTHTGEPPFSCTFCGSHFRRLSHLRAHRCTHRDEQLFHCPDCIQEKEEKKKKKALMETPGRRDVCCLLCDRKFSSRLALRRHMGIHQGNKPYGCQLCPYRTRLKASLLQHNRIHTGEKPFRCADPGCSYASVDRSALLRHTRTHTQQKPYHCLHCSYSCIQKKSMDLHARRHHTGEWFPCQQCPYSSPDRQLLLRHVRRHHPSPRHHDNPGSDQYDPDRQTRVKSLCKRK